MLTSKLEIFFGRFAIYIIGLLAVVGLICGVGWYVSAYELSAAKARTQLVETQLSVSNASYASIRGQFKLLTTTLESNQEKALASHAVLRANLEKIIENDKSMVATETFLLTRSPETQCKTPKELADVWAKM